MSIYERIKSKIKACENGCMIWTGYTDSSGYPRIKVMGKRELAAKIAFPIFGISLKEGAIIHNKCGERLCVNPLHFRIGRDHVKPVLRRLKRADVEEIKNSYLEGLTASELARKFNCSTRMVRNIIRGESWKNV